MTPYEHFKPMPKVFFYFHQMATFEAFIQKQILSEEIEADGYHILTNRQSPHLEYLVGFDQAHEFELLVRTVVPRYPHRLSVFAAFQTNKFDVSMGFFDPIREGDFLTNFFHSRNTPISNGRPYRIHFGDTGKSVCWHFQGAEPEEKIPILGPTPELDYLFLRSAVDTGLPGIKNNNNEITFSPDDFIAESLVPFNIPPDF